MSATLNQPSASQRPSVQRPSARASVRTIRVSAFKVRPVLRKISGKSYEEAEEILQFCDRGVAEVILKCMRSAAANAEHNEGLEPTDMFVGECYANEGPTLKRWRPRARGRATQIHKRTCHVSIALSQYSPEELQARAERQTNRTGTAAAAAEARRRRVAASRDEEPAEETADTPEDLPEETAEALAETPESTTEDTPTEAAETPEPEATDPGTPEDGTPDPGTPKSGTPESDATAPDAESDSKKDAPKAEDSK